MKKGTVSPPTPPPTSLIRRANNRIKSKLLPICPVAFTQRMNLTPFATGAISRYSHSAERLQAAERPVPCLPLGGGGELKKELGRLPQSAGLQLERGHGKQLSGCFSHRGHHSKAIQVGGGSGRKNGTTHLLLLLFPCVDFFFLFFCHKLCTTDESILPFDEIGKI